MITALDKNDKEVFIEAKIVQITLGDEYQMGVNWEKLYSISSHTGVSLSSNFSYTRRDYRPVWAPRP